MIMMINLIALIDLLYCTEIPTKFSRKTSGVMNEILSQMNLGDNGQQCCTMNMKMVNFDFVSI